MDLHLSDKHILITGGSKGIGLACARGFLTEGARVSLVSRDRANLDAAQAQLQAAFPSERIHTVAANLRDASAALAALDAAEAAFGPVDVLVNSAGAAKRTPASELTPEAFADAMQAKYFTTIHMLTPCIQRMAEPEEIANAVLFLASSKASYVTGICMSMDGALNPIVV